MNANLEDRLRQFYVERTANLPAAGPGLPSGGTEDRTVETELATAEGVGHRRPASLRWFSAAAAALLLAVVGAGLVLTSRGRSTLPPGFTTGQFGTEVVLREVDDADNSSDTVRLQATPGGTVTITTGAATRASTGVSTPNGDIPATEVEVCIEAGDAGGRCGAAPAEPEMMLGSRGPAGQAVIDGIGRDVAAVRFDAGPANLFWSRPVRGVVLFPLTEQATPQATATLVRTDGSTVARLQAESTSLTATEITAAQVSHPTSVTLAAAWTVTDAPAPFVPSASNVFTRLHGRTVLTGFDGPFAAQQLAVRNDADPVNSVVWVLTVPTDRLDDVSRRIAVIPNGRLTQTREPGDGTSVLLWAGDAIPAGATDGLLDRATTATDPRSFKTNLDVTRVWDGGSNPGRVGLSDDVLGGMLNDVVTTVSIDGTERTLWAAADDVGTVFYRLSLIGTSESPGYGIAQVGSRTTIELLEGRMLGPGLWPVPATTATLTVTLDDGSTVTPQIIDVRRLSNAKLAVFPQRVAGRTVVSVVAT